MELRRVLEILYRNVWLVLISIAVCVAAFSGLYFLLSDDSGTVPGVAVIPAEALLFEGNALVNLDYDLQLTADITPEMYQQKQQQIANNVLKWLNSNSVYTAITEKCEADLSAAGVKNRTLFTMDANSNILQINVKDLSSDGAVNLANTAATEVARMIPGAIPEIQSAQIMDYAANIYSEKEISYIEGMISGVLKTDSTGQSDNRLFMMIGVGLIFGIFLGMAAAFFREYITPKVTTAEQATAILDVPILSSYK